MFKQDVPSVCVKHPILEIQRISGTSLRLESKSVALIKLSGCEENDSATALRKKNHILDGFRKKSLRLDLFLLEK